MNRQTVLRKIRDQAPSNLARVADSWLNDDVEELPERPGEVIVSQAASLWRIRQKNLMLRGKDLAGANEFLIKLDSLNPAKKLKQLSFHGSTSSGSVFFEKTNGRFVGFVIVNTEKNQHFDSTSFAAQGIAARVSI